MRDLLIIRGAPASGKTTWLTENALLPYTLAPDTVRSLYSCPVADPVTGELYMDRRYDTKVWNFIEEMMELRMHTGQFIVLDAQDSGYNRWIKLAKKYGYRVWYKEMDTPLAVCRERNEHRIGTAKLPFQAMEFAIQWLNANPLPASIKPVPDDLVKGSIAPVNVDQYDELYFCGDIHGCYTALTSFRKDKEAFSNPKELFVFVGDYLDRGLQNKETLELLVSLRDNPNVIFLEGNHCWEKLWASNRAPEIKSDEFLQNTLPQIKDVDKRAVKEWCAKWQELAYLEYRGKRYFVTHAGIGYMPEHPAWLPSRTYTRGGHYEEDVDRAWCEQCYGENFIQIHGHRNFYGYDIDEATESINLNSPVEYGADWRVYSVDKVNNITYYLFENPIHRELDPRLEEFMLEPNKILEEPNP